MRVMVIVKASRESEAGEMPSTQVLEAMTAFNEALVEAGVMLGGEGLQPTATGYRVTFSGNACSVAAGPFGATNELAAGFWIWRVGTMEEAIGWARRIPFEEGEVELRRIFEAEDFGDELTTDLREREARMREGADGVA